jgi:hypothetical protein
MDGMPCHYHHSSLSLGTVYLLLLSPLKSMRGIFSRPQRWRRWGHSRSLRIVVVVAVVGLPVALMALTSTTTTAEALAFSLPQQRSWTRRSHDKSGCSSTIGHHQLHRRRKYAPLHASAVPETPLASSSSSTLLSFNSKHILFDVPVSNNGARCRIIAYKVSWMVGGGAICESGHECVNIDDRSVYITTPTYSGGIHTC